MFYFGVGFLTLCIITFSKTELNLCGGKLYKDPEGQLVEILTMPVQ